MIRSVIMFWGSGFDGFGMPVPYHSYLVVASPFQSDHDGIASIISLSASSPLSQPHHRVQQGGPRAALESAITALRAEPGNSGLEQHRHDEP